MKILLSDSFDASCRAGCKVRHRHRRQGRPARREVILIRSDTKATAEYIAGAPKLKIIIRGGVGLDNVDATPPGARNQGLQHPRGEQRRRRRVGVRLPPSPFPTSSSTGTCR